MNCSNITIISMAGCGKSSVGIVLAELLGWKFLDIDIILEEEHRKKLHDIWAQLGDEKFIKLEGEKIEEYSNAKNAVFAPGGSIVYSINAMAVLKNISTVICVSTDIEKIEERIDTTSRGVVGIKGISFQELFTKRKALYRKYADMTIESEEKSPQDIAKEILLKLNP